MYELTEINVFPIKSLGGIQCDFASLTSRGLENDRRFMLVDEKGNFLTQRKLPRMSQLLVSVQGNHLVVKSRQNPSQPALEIPSSNTLSGETQQVQIWNDRCDAVLLGDKFDIWFSQQLGISCQLVYMPEDSRRLVDTTFARECEVVSFADGFPSLIIGESALADLNRRLESFEQPSINMDRFRTNLAFSGGPPFAEDAWKRIRIGTAEFAVVKPCARCTLTTVDPETSETGPEPLRTLSTFRKQEEGVMFGQNLLHLNEGSLAIGDKIEVLE